MQQRVFGAIGMTRLIICGGGLAGGLVALALAKRRPEIDLLLVESGERVGGNHIWSFFDTDIAEEARWVVDLVARRRWPDHEIRFPARERVIPIGYNSIQSLDLDSAVRAALRPEQLRLNAVVSEVGPTHVVAHGERIEADAVIDARGPQPTPGIELGWQKFVGQVCRFDAPHGVPRPMIMDATVDQIDGYRFVYLLPLSRDELLIEDTYYSTSPIVDFSALKARIGEYAGRFGGFNVIADESGVLPVVIGGELRDLWPAGDRVPRLGLRGGFFHPTTGYSLPDAAANAALVADQHDCSTEALNTLLRGRSEALWRERHFFQLLNRMLFRAAEPRQRYRVLEHFYRLPAALIGRFYAGRLTMLDKLRIVSGRPPVPIGRAIAAMRRRAA